MAAITATITLEDGSHELKYPNSVVKKIDQELGYSAMHIVEKTQKHGRLASLGLSDLATVVWGGMLHKRPGQTVDQVADLIPIRPIDKYANIAAVVFNIIMDIYGMEVPEEEETGNKKAGRGNGTGSKSKD